jgi:hypothetical protein
MQAIHLKRQPGMLGRICDHVVSNVISAAAGATAAAEPAEDAAPSYTSAFLAARPPPGQLLAAQLHPVLRNRENLMLVPIVTPLTAGHELDIPSLERYISFLFSCGCGGLYIAGSSGEGYNLPLSLREQLLEECVRLSAGSGKLLIVHVGAASNADAYRLAEHAGTTTVDMVASIPPYVGVPAASFAEVKQYYSELHRRAGGKPTVCCEFSFVSRRSTPLTPCHYLTAQYT